MLVSINPSGDEFFSLKILVVSDSAKYGIRNIKHTVGSGTCHFHTSGSIYT